MKYLKTAGYLLLILILFLQSGGIQLFYQFQQYCVQVNMQQVLANPETAYLKMTLPLNDYYKCRVNTHEISVDGKMYDVKSVTITANSAELLAVKDAEEGNIIDEIKKLASGKPIPQSKLPDNMVKLLGMNYLASLHVNGFSSGPCLEHVYHFYSESFSCQYGDVFSPPPERV